MNRNRTTWHNRSPNEVINRNLDSAFYRINTRLDKIDAKLASVKSLVQVPNNLSIRHDIAISLISSAMTGGITAGFALGMGQRASETIWITEICIFVFLMFVGTILLRHFSTDH